MLSSEQPDRATPTLVKHLAAQTWVNNAQTSELNETDAFWPEKKSQLMPRNSNPVAVGVKPC